MNKNEKKMALILAVALAFVICIAAVLVGIRAKNPKVENTTEPLSSDVSDTTVATQTTVPVTQNTSKRYATSEVTLNIRSGPGVDYDLLGTVAPGTKIEVVNPEPVDGWYEITHEGQKGYVSATYAVLQEPLTDPDGNEVKYVDPSQGDWNMILVNAWNAFDETYEPEIVAVCGGLFFDTAGTTQMTMDVRAATHYTEMYNAALHDGVTLKPISGYRSYALQRSNWKARIANEEAAGASHSEAVRRASEVILPPGTSEHNLGISMDICSLSETFETTPEFAWLQEHAAEYGFILRYPKDKEDVTGIVYEPWHWRYVGTENAQSIKDSGLCLEEYVEKYGA